MGKSQRYQAAVYGHKAVRNHWSNLRRFGQHWRPEPEYGPHASTGRLLGTVWRFCVAVKKVPCRGLFSALETIMKKNKLANLAMLLIIAGILVCGLATAFHLRGGMEAVTAGGTSATLPDAAEGDLCTIEIRCDTLLDHLELLGAEKAEFVPPDGSVLEKTAVSFSEGETVFDVLRRVCNGAQIQLEYSWTPFYDSYYIEGINHLYEFDCGSESGWMYQVNGEFPNCGCSGYTVQPGDEIVWSFTCAGLGKDVGKIME